MDPLKRQKRQEEREKEKEHTAEMILDIRDGIDAIVEMLNKSPRLFDSLMTHNFTKVLAEKKAIRDARKQEQGPRYKNEDLDNEIEKYENFLKRTPSEILKEDYIDKMREILRNKRYTPYQLQRLRRYLGPHTDKMSIYQAIQNLRGSPRDAKNAAQIIYNAIVANVQPPKEPPEPIPDTFSLKWFDPRKTDQQGNPYYPPYDDEGFLPTDFDKTSLSQSDAAKNARIRMQERRAPKDPFSETPYIDRAGSVDTTKQKQLTKDNEERLKLKEKQREQRKKHFEQQAKERRGGE